jgi:hypothetical protein
MLWPVVLRALWLADSPESPIEMRFDMIRPYERIVVELVEAMFWYVPMP